MRKFSWILFFAVITMIAATSLFLMRLRGHQHLGKPGVVVGNMPLFDPETNRVAETTVILPQQVTGFFSKTMPVTQIELTTLPPDTTYGKRRYWDTNGIITDVSVILMGQDRTSLHKPQFCLTGQGWTIEETKTVTVKMAKPYPYELPMLKLIASTRIKGKDGNPITIRGIYAYWFVADKKIGIADQRMWSIMKSFLETGTLERWAYISYFSVCPPGQDIDQLFDGMKELIAKSVPEFQLAAGDPLSGSKSSTIQTASK